VAGLGEEETAALVDLVHRPVLAELARRDAPFHGLLYAGLMLTESGPRVLEFNCRFGDPETQVVVPRLEGDLLELLAAAAGGDLGPGEVATSPECAVTIVLASKGYPDSSEVGVEIGGVEEAERLGAFVFHAGTALRDGALVSAGGRVLGVTALGPTCDDARRVAYSAVECIDFPGVQYRRDIAVKAAR
jgi:phosphoribosylamine--glycine ligase